MRDLPNGSHVIAAVPGGTVVQVLYGQSVVNGLVWLEVRLANGRIGWIAAYLLTITLERPPGTGTPNAPATQAAAATPTPSATLLTTEAPIPAETQAEPGPTATATNTEIATLAPPTSEAPTDAPATSETPSDTPPTEPTAEPLDFASG